MIKKGFTLAEVLVAMGVVGVVSAIVIPQVTSNVEKNKTGLQVAKVVEQTEVACQNYLKKDTSAQYFSLKEAFNANNITTVNSKYEALADLQGLKKRKVGVSVYYDSDTELSGTGDEEKLIAYVIDTNGTEVKPNLDGRDRFIFYLTDSCRMVPYGADDMKYKTDCDPKSSSGIVDYKTCAARLVRDGYKINY